MFLADISEDNDEPDDGAEMNFFYIRQFQVHLNRMHLVILFLFNRFKRKRFGSEKLALFISALHCSKM